MGCDIHLYVEYKKRSEKDSWWSFGKRFNPGRNYWLFGIMAQVRCQTPFSYEPRGFAEGIAYSASEDLYSYIDESDRNGMVSVDTAKTYEKLGSVIIFRGGEPFKVSNPDSHTHSWLSFSEFTKCLRECEKEPKSWLEAEYRAVHAAMKIMEKNNYETRIVFWFDN